MTEFDDNYDIDEIEADPGKPSAKDNLKKGLSGSGKALMWTFVLVVVMLIVAGYFVVNATKGPERSSESSVSEAPKDAAGAPTGEGADPRYKELVEKENEQRISEAERTGRSAIPTLVDEGEEEDPDLAELNGEEDCSAECMEMRESVKAAEDAAAKAKAESERLRQQMADLQAQDSGNAVQPDRIVYKDHLYLSQAAEESRVDRMVNEMRSVSHVVAGGSKMGWADSVSMGSGANGNQQDRNVGGSPQGQGDSEMMARNEDERASGEFGDEKVIIPATSMPYATLDLTANSDVPGPIKATVQQGEYKGSEVLGSFTREGDYLVMKFNSMTTPAGKTYDINAIAVNPSTRMIGHADEVNRHLLLRFGAVFGSAFLEGVGSSLNSAIQGATSFGGSNGTVVNTNGTSTQDSYEARREVIDQVVKDYELHALGAVGKVGEKAGQMAEPLIDKPPTVIKYADTGMALLFLDDVTE